MTFQLMWKKWSREDLPKSVWLNFVWDCGRRMYTKLKIIQRRNPNTGEAPKFVRKNICVAQVCDSYTLFFSVELFTKLAKKVFVIGCHVIYWMAKTNWLQKLFDIGCHLVIYWKAKNEALVRVSKKVFLKKDVLRASSHFPSSRSRVTTKISWMHWYLWCSAARSSRERELR